MNIEPLEARIAPASGLVTYTDIDGDLVKVSASTPGALPLSFAGKLTFIGGGTEGQLAARSHRPRFRRRERHLHHHERGDGERSRACRRDCGAGR